jgi:hypothetical protein
MAKEKIALIILIMVLLTRILPSFIKKRFSN